jgi:hypothetical protein
MQAVLKGSNGWRRTFELTPETAFDGNKFQSKSTLNICSLRDLITGTENWQIFNINNIRYRSTRT